MAAMRMTQLLSICILRRPWQAQRASDCLSMGAVLVLHEIVVVDLAQLERKQPCLIELAGVLVASSTVLHHVLELIARELHLDCRNLALFDLGLLVMPPLACHLVSLHLELLFTSGVRSSILLVHDRCHINSTTNTCCCILDAQRLPGHSCLRVEFHRLSYLNFLAIAVRSTLHAQVVHQSI